MSHATPVSCAYKLSKREITYELGKGRLIHKRGGRGCEPEPRRERARALTPSHSDRFVHKRPHSLQAACKSWSCLRFSQSVSMLR